MCLRVQRRLASQLRLRLGPDHVRDGDGDFDCDERDDHQLEPRVVRVRQLARQQLHQLAAVVQLLVHHLKTQQNLDRTGRSWVQLGSIEEGTGLGRTLVRLLMFKWLHVLW